jgi:hypothetical protein
MEVLRDQNWLLSLGTFLPLAGVLVMLFIPKKEELLHKQVALVTALATLGVGVYTLTQFNYDQSQHLQFFASTNWISDVGNGGTGRQRQRINHNSPCSVLRRWRARLPVRVLLIACPFRMGREGLLVH